MLDYIKRLAGPYTGEGETTFSFGFKVFEPTDVYVAVASSDQGSATTLVYGSDYSVALNDDQEATPGGSVTVVSPLVSGELLVIGSAVDYTQEVQLTNYSRFPPSIINDALDRIVMQIQQLVERIGRAITVPATSSSTVDEIYERLITAAEKAETALALSEETIAAAEAVQTALDEAGDVTGAVPVAAAGATESRAISAHFADLVNVRNYGAKGDGTTDDTDAFARASAAANGAAVFVPAGEYKITSPVAGKFICLGDVVAPRIDLTVLWREFPSPNGLQDRPLDCGGDLPNQSATHPHNLGRAFNSPSYDPFDNVLYYNGNTSNGRTQAYAIRWSDNPDERVLLGQSPWLFDFFGHQCNFLYRPTPKHPVRFLCKTNAYKSANTPDYTENLHAHLISWDYANPDTFEILRNFTLFPSDAFDNEKALQIGLSPDGRVLVARATRRSDSALVIRVWDFPAVMQGETDDISASYKMQYVQDSRIGSAGGQGIYTDGKFIYFATGVYAMTAVVTTLDGKYCFSQTGGYGGYLSEVSEYAGLTVEPEHEGIFWAVLNGVWQRFAAISLVVRATIVKRTDVTTVNNGDDTATITTVVTDYTTSPATVTTTTETIELQGSEIEEGTETSYEYSSSEDTFLRINRYYCTSIAASSGVVHLDGTEYLTGDKVISNWRPQQYYQCTGYTKGVTEYNANYIWSINFVDALGLGSSRRLGMVQCAVASGSGMTRTGLYAYDSAGGSDYGSLILYKPVGKSPYVGSPMINVNGGVLGGESSTNARTVGIWRANRDGTDGGTAIVRYKENSGSIDDGLAYVSIGERNKEQLYGVLTLRYTRTDARVTSGTLRPGTYATNALSLGDSTYPWTQLYASTSTIATSDEREKQNIEAIPEAVLRAWGDVEFLQFRFRDAVAKKGGAARLHTGVIAQRVKAAFEAHGIDPFAYGLLCYDKWEYDPATKTSAGDRYAVRYEECLALECAYQRWRLAKIEARLGDA